LQFLVPILVQPAHVHFADQLLLLAGRKNDNVPVLISKIDLAVGHQLLKFAVGEFFDLAEGMNEVMHQHHGHHGQQHIPDRERNFIVHGTAPIKYGRRPALG